MGQERQSLKKRRQAIRSRFHRNKQRKESSHKYENPCSEMVEQYREYLRESGSNPDDLYWWTMRRWALANGYNFHHDCYELFIQKNFHERRAKIARKEEWIQEGLEKSNLEKNTGSYIKRLFDTEVDPVERLKSVKKAMGGKRRGQLSVQSMLQFVIFSELSRDPDSRLELREYLLFLEKTTHFLDDVLLIKGVYNLFRYREMWIRSLDDWEIGTYNASRQFTSLTRHLLCRYDVPEFMDEAWWNRRSLYREWFVHIGNGVNMRKAKGIPKGFTRKMAHDFLHTPEGYDIQSALIRAHVLSFGGSEEQARLLVQTKLNKGSYFRECEFKQSVIRFFLRNPMLDPAQYEPLLDYIWFHKFRHERIWVHGEERIAGPPPNPGFSMKGRSVESLIRQMERWHETLGKVAVKGIPEAWAPSGIEGTSWVEEGSDPVATWRIQEIRNYVTLLEEGRILRHCVASYADSCAAGRSSIWSLYRQSGGQETRVLTIQVWNRDREIQQVRGKSNRMPTPKEVLFLKRWAKKAKLELKIDF